MSRWFFLVIATASFLSGACRGQFASCTYSSVCAGTQTATAPTYFFTNCGFRADQAEMKGQANLINDIGGPITSVKYSQRTLLYDNGNPQHLRADSTEIANAFPCNKTSGCGTLWQLVTIDTRTSECPCTAGSQYETTYVVGTHWDASSGFTYTFRSSPFSTAPF